MYLVICCKFRDIPFLFQRVRRCRPGTSPPRSGTASTIAAPPEPATTAPPPLISTPSTTTLATPGTSTASTTGRCTITITTTWRLSTGASSCQVLGYTWAPTLPVRRWTGSTPRLSRRTPRTPPCQVNIKVEIILRVWDLLENWKKKKFRI